MSLDVLKKGPIRLMSLNEYLPGSGGSSSSSGSLHDQADSSFGAHPVTTRDEVIGIEDTDEAHFGEVESFGDHLSADQHVELLSAKVSQGVPELILPLHGIRIDTGNSRLRKRLAKHLLHPLRAKACKANPRITT